MLFRKLRWLCAVYFLLDQTTLAEVHPRAFSVELSAKVTNSPARIILSWRADPDAAYYTIDRKLPADLSWTRLTTLTGSATNYTDTTVAAGTVYEYQALKTTTWGYPGSGYIATGINAPPTEYRGKVILLVDNTHSAALATELTRLERDLIGDGWTVARHDVSSAMTPPAVKQIIQSEYTADPQNTRAVFLFGHIAVPYSGNYSPDQHENHTGAWPADAYYADLDGAWTDSTVLNITAEKTWNHNRPGDGKFDQSAIPSEAELEVGRVDLHKMTCFANKTPARSELDLLRQYLNKDHNFRHAKFSMNRRGAILDSFGEAEGEGYGATGWRNFGAFFGSENQRELSWGTFFPTLKAESFLCAFGAGGGGYYTCDGVGGSDDFALNDIKSVFTFYFGSYFGDWDNESAFLRAPLGSTSYTLVSAWAGRPHWFMHPMGMGETIGHSTLLTLNAEADGLYEPNEFEPRGVHIALMGDPTLRLHPVAPPTNVALTKQTNGMALSWSAATDTNLLGYFVYRASAPSGPFQRISGANPVTTLNYADPAGTESHTYMVRTLKNETTPSGSYQNLSQGIFASLGALPAAPQNLTAVGGQSAISLTWQDKSTNENGFTIFRRASNESAFSERAAVGANVTTFQDSVTAGVVYTYKVRAWNNVGASAFSNEAAAQTAVGSTAALVNRDASTGGTWIGTYGSEGHYIIEDSVALPAYVTAGGAGYSPWTWDYSPTSPAALQRPAGNSRIAACWYSSAPWDVQFTFKDTATHRVSLYFLDWDKMGRVQTVQLIDANTSALLGSETVTNFGNGVYLTWDMKGAVRLRLTPSNGNAVLSGIFFDSNLPRAQTPMISPAAGTYSDSVTVSITAETGAQIRYTLDGADPSASSTLYGGPFALTNNATVKARAFKSGMLESTVASAAYKVVSSSIPTATAQFLGTNTTAGGTWKGSFGLDGHITIADHTALPAYASVTPTGHSQWVWQYSSQDPRALQRWSAGGRMAACWYATTTFDVDVNITGSTARKISFYSLDLDNAGRKQTIEVIDFDTKRVLHTLSLNDFRSGVYSQYRIKGRVIIRFTKVASHNAVLSGIFFDP